MWILLALQFLFLIGYVAGSVAFPKPLSPEEEEECLRRMRQGDQEAREELNETCVWSHILLESIPAKENAEAGKRMT